MDIFLYYYINNYLFFNIYNYYYNHYWYFNYQYHYHHYHYYYSKTVKNTYRASHLSWRQKFADKHSNVSSNSATQPFFFFRICFLTMGELGCLSFSDYFSLFCFLLIEFHCTFSISYQILQYYLYYYCILIRMW